MKKITLKDSHSKLPKSVQDIVCMIFDVDSMKKAMKEFEVNLTFFPTFTAIVICSLFCLCILVAYIAYSKDCVKWPFSKRPNNGFQDQLSLNAGQKYSATLPTFIKLPFVIKIIVLSIFEWQFYTGFREHSGSVVECLTRDRGAAGTSLTGVTALCP